MSLSHTDDDAGSGLPLPWCNLGRGICWSAPPQPHNPRGHPTAVEASVGTLELAALAQRTDRLALDTACRRSVAVLLDAAEGLEIQATREYQARRSNVSTPASQCDHVCVASGKGCMSCAVLAPAYQHGLVPILLAPNQALSVSPGTGAFPYNP